ncbi:hypothetical protein CERSUDRAFT_77670 [Gelatoporia subvermispora B]|uniref:Cytochrome P450 n=1 Tax=Ceriporiopsis subvermispora (strain B) TaxID=914234 RepID=M2QIZ7_CERS8|nr:hypothetical protein CERSUDRAFT_77670 [Gelatoporia subvermispora B]
MPQTLTVLLALSVSFVVVILRRFFDRRSLNYIRGPTASFLFGHILDITRQRQVGELDTKWNKEFGNAWRIRDCFGVWCSGDFLMLTDPKAIQHICQKSGYDYPKDNKLTNIARLTTGNGVLAAIGVCWDVGRHDHIRQRNVMTSSFTTSRLRQYVSMFQKTASKMVDTWKDELFSGSENALTIAMNHWLPRATLDIIGEAACSYEFGTLDNKDTELAEAYKNLFADSLMFPSKWDILFKATWNYLPIRLLQFVDYLPAREYRRFRSTVQIMNRVAKNIIDEKIREGTPSTKRDIVDLMLNANETLDSKQKLSRAELADQIATLVIAGHETTASTLNYILWELAKASQYQAKIRKEIRILRDAVAQRGDLEYTSEDLESMKYAVAVVKETLRLHPIVFHTTREAARDDVIPLSESIRSTTGELIKSIPVRKRQIVLLSFWGYNRLPDVWGEDADTWNPERFLESEATRTTNVGLYANLLTFSAGVRGCIGWRFAVLETLSFLVELLEHFEFSIPPEKPDIVRIATGGIMSPFIRDAMHLGPMMPLQVAPLRE